MKMHWEITVDFIGFIFHFQVINDHEDAIFFLDVCCEEGRMGVFVCLWDRYDSRFFFVCACGETFLPICSSCVVTSFVCFVFFS